MNLSLEEMIRIVEKARTRPRYIVELLTFKFGREPTQEEIDEVNRDFVLRRYAYQEWLAMQPWHIRKHHVEREDRIAKILIKRYNVPEWLIKMFKSEFEGDW